MKDTTTEETELKQLKNGAKYVYALAQSGGRRVYDLCGIDEQPVYAISQGSIAAVVSDRSRQKIRPERAHLIAHKEVLKQLMLESTVLPMTFGTIADKPQGRTAHALEERRNSPGKVETG